VIVVWGAANDPPAAELMRVLHARRLAFAHVDDQAIPSLRYEMTIGAETDGWIELTDGKLNLAAVTAMYLRPGPQPSSGRPAANAAALLAIASNIRGTVVNRPAAGLSNMSKPLQLAMIAAAGLATPQTLITTDPAAAKAFLAQHGRVVYKSISGIRSIVGALEVKDATRLDRVATGPVQLQRWIEGTDVRVHVVGERWFATAIESHATDYRYAGRDHEDLTMSDVEVEPAVAARLVGVTRNMGLLVSGIDLRRTPAGEWFCFEVNPSPGFTFYEQAGGQQVANAIADLLSADTSVHNPSRAKQSSQRASSPRSNVT